MTSERIKEIQQATAYPDSLSVHQALLQVWNECEQDKEKCSEEEVFEIIAKFINDAPTMTKEWLTEQFKKKK